MPLPSPRRIVTGIPSFRRLRSFKNSLRGPNSPVWNWSIFWESGVPWAGIFWIAKAGLGIIEFSNFGGPDLDVTWFSNFVIRTRIWLIFVQFHLNRGNSKGLRYWFFSSFKIEFSGRWDREGKVERAGHACTHMAYAFIFLLCCSCHEKMKFRKF